VLKFSLHRGKSAVPIVKVREEVDLVRELIPYQPKSVDTVRPLQMIPGLQKANSVTKLPTLVIWIPLLEELLESVIEHGHELQDQSSPRRSRYDPRHGRLSLLRLIVARLVIRVVLLNCLREVDRLDDPCGVLR
jgi:hypothetical protein